ncbi:hypothetical protein C8J57DRAFT_1361740 [Mycena rebaudengoi]|nr:hypothetical protein C8J57DRAFT_1361740 [Mycena rebaudengoi]
MIPLIRLIKPDFAFILWAFSPPKHILSLLENIGNPPEDLVQLWEDYQFMDSLQNHICEVLNSPQTDDNGSCLSAEDFQMLSQCALLPRILQVYILGPINYMSLFKIHHLLDISWADLRAAMCPLRYITGRADREGMRRLLWFVAQHLSPEITIGQLSLELAQGCVKLMKRGKWHFNLTVPWGCFIRSSPHSLELLHDICQVSFDPHELKGLPNSVENYHNTLQWLKAFPDPPQDFIEVWEQHLIAASRLHPKLWQYDQYDPEQWWRRWQANRAKWFPH